MLREIPHKAVNGLTSLFLFLAIEGLAIWQFIDAARDESGVRAALMGVVMLAAIIALMGIAWAVSLAGVGAMIAMPIQ